MAADWIRATAIERACVFMTGSSYQTFCVAKNFFHSARCSAVAIGIGAKCSPSSITDGFLGSAAGQLGRPGALGLPVFIKFAQ